jgi:parallel beta-helix repeat protein
MNILWGIVMDQYGLPFEGARVRIYFDDYYLENYSKPNGIYRITDIPVTNYLKNVTAFMEGYEEKWFLLPLLNNSYKDFVLVPIIKTFYVGGDGDNNYSRIKDAIKDAKNGNTIYVYSGIYDENIGIYDFQDIKLLGEDKDTTIIDGNNENKVMSISYSSGIIRNFTIRNSNDRAISNYSGISISSSDFNISNVIFSSNKIGISFSNRLFYRKTIRIYDCIFEDNDIGIKIDLSTAIIVNNEINNNNCGIHFSNGNSGVIKYNDIKNNKEYGFEIYYSFSNNIHSNNFEKNKIGLSLPFSIPSSEGNIIWFNNFIRNRESVHDYANNNFYNNYWSDWIGHYIKILNYMPYFIRPIFTIDGLHYNFDMTPLKEPYDIQFSEVKIE